MSPLTVCCYCSLLHVGSLSSLNLSTGTLHPHCTLEKRSWKDGNIWSPETAGAQSRWDNKEKYWNNAKGKGDREGCKSCFSSSRVKPWGLALGKVKTKSLRWPYSADDWKWFQWENEVRSKNRFGVMIICSYLGNWVWHTWSNSEVPSHKKSKRQTDRQTRTML